MSLKAIEPDFTSFDPKDYLKDYYSKIGSENHGLLEFLVKAYRDVDGDSVMLEFGGGPTVYPLIPAAPKVREIHFADYLEENLEEVRMWKEESTAAFEWRRFFRKTLSLEGTKRVSKRQIKGREDLVREKLTKFLKCDAFKTHPLGVSHHHRYDIVNVNFVAESITSSKKVWTKIIYNICSLLKRNGILIMSAIKEAENYRVGKKLFPAVGISEEDLIEVLTPLGFEETSFMLSSIPAEVTNEELKGYSGYKGIIFLKARR